MMASLFGLFVILMVSGVSGLDPCSRTLLTGPNAIPDDHLTASSIVNPADPNTVTGPERGRLFSLATTLSNGTKLTGGWAPAVDKKDEYIQANFDDLTYIEQVITQGRNLGNGHVTSYKVGYTEDGVHWKPVLDSNGAIKIFNGNKDANTPVMNKLDCPVFAKGIRIVPVTWDSHIALRFDLLGCPLDDTGPSFTTLSQPQPTSTVSITTPTTPLTTPTIAITTPTTPLTTPTAQQSTGQTTPITTIPPFMPGIMTPFGTTSLINSVGGLSTQKQQTVMHTKCLQSATDCHGQPDGDYQYCLSCNEFATCTNGYFYTKHCGAPTLKWDDVVKMCVLNSQTCV